MCLSGLLASLLLIGAVLVARQHALLQTITTSYTPLSGEAKWEGDWEFSDLGGDPSEAGSQAGADRVTIPFSGTDFALQVRRGDYRGYFFVSVDGEPANRLPRDERGAYLVLTSPDCAPQVVTIPVASGLEDGSHTAVIVAERGWDQWPLGGWSVSRIRDAATYRWALVVLVTMGGGCLAGAVCWGGSWMRGAGGRRQGTEDMLHPAWSGSLRLSDGLALAITLASATVFYFSPWLPLTLASGVALALLVLLRLDVGLALVATTAPFYLHPRSLCGKTFSMAEIVTLLCTLSWGLRLLANRRSHAERQTAGCRLKIATSNLRSAITSLDQATLFLVLIAVVSLFVAEYRHVALRELRVLILEPALFYLMLRTTRLDDRAVWRVVDFFVLGAVVVAFIGLVQYALGVNIITAEMGFRRLRSVYGSPNNAGLYLGRGLPVMVAVGLFSRSRGRRIAYGLAALPVGLAVLLSFSKGALILGVPLSLLALGVLAGGRWLWASLGAMVAAAVAAIPLLGTPRFALLLDTQGGTTFFRLQIWRSSWTMFREHPWLGVGLDNFLYHYRSRYILPAAWQEPDISQAHNVLLNHATRLGIAGLAVGVWLQVAFWRLALPLRRLTKPDHRALALGLMGSMVNFLAHGLVDGSFFFIDLAFAFFLTLGVVQWLAGSETDELEA
jgi:putative inorganic carbon (HCO3(-)) transporter